MNNELLNLWENHFSNLRIVSGKRLLQVLYPLLVGFDLIRLPRVKEYRPFFVLYSLWGNKMGKNIKACLSGPILQFPVVDKNKLLLNVPIAADLQVQLLAIEQAKEQVPFDLGKDISAHRLFKLLYQAADDIAKDNGSLVEAGFFELMLELALFSGNRQLPNEVLRIISKKSKKWKKAKQFSSVHGEYEQWYKGLQSKDASVLFRIAQENSKKSSLKDLEKYRVIF